MKLTLRAIFFGLAGVLFLLAGLLDQNTGDLLAFGLALLAAGLLVGELPRGGRGSLLR
jgi:hypothetical protein